MEPRNERYREDSELIESLHPRCDEPHLDQSAEAVEVYTNGACWYLAWWMHQLTGHQIATIGGYDGQVLDTIEDPGPWDAYLWTHLGLMIDEEFLDVTGRIDADEAMEMHLDTEGEEHGIYFVTDEEFASIIFDPTQMSVRAAEITKAIAERVIARHNVVALHRT